MAMMTHKPRQLEAPRVLVVYDGSGQRCARDSKYLYYFSSVPPRNVCRITITVDTFLLNDEAT